MLNLSLQSFWCTIIFCSRAKYSNLEGGHCLGDPFNKVGNLEMRDQLGQNYKSLRCCLIEMIDLSVDARVASPSTTNAPTHDSQQLLDQFSYKRYERFLFQSKHLSLYNHPCLGRLVGEERSAAVSLARVLSSFRETGADHGIRHRVPETVLSIWHRDLLLFIFKYLTRPLRKKRCSPRHLQRAPQPVEDHLRSSQSFPPAGPFSKYVLYPYINLSP